MSKYCRPTLEMEIASMEARRSPEEQIDELRQRVRSLEAALQEMSNSLVEIRKIAKEGASYAYRHRRLG